MKSSNTLSTSEQVPIYRVEFGWKSDSYNDRSVGLRSVTMNVEAANKFEAAANAWGMLATLNLDEPDTMNVRKISTCS